MRSPILNFAVLFKCENSIKFCGYDKITYTTIDQKSLLSPSFIEAIQYLIENRVILVPISESGSGTSQIVPSWIKNNAC